MKFWTDPQKSYQSHQVVNTLHDSRTTKNSSCISWTLERVLCRRPLVIVYISGLMTPNERCPEIKTRHVSLSPNQTPQLCFIIYHFLLGWGITLIQEQLQWKCCTVPKLQAASISNHWWSNFYCWQWSEMKKHTKQFSLMHYNVMNAGLDTYVLH